MLHWKYEPKNTETQKMDFKSEDCKRYDHAIIAKICVNIRQIEK